VSGACSAWVAHRAHQADHDLAAPAEVELRDYVVTGIETPDLVNVDNIVEADDILLAAE
jgi:hypothetical protein